MRRHGGGSWFSLDASDFPVKQEARSSTERDEVEEAVLGEQREPEIQQS